MPARYDRKMVSIITLCSGHIGTPTRPRSFSWPALSRSRVVTFGSWVCLSFRRMTRGRPMRPTIAAGIRNTWTVKNWVTRCGFGEGTRERQLRDRRPDPRNGMEHLVPDGGRGDYELVEGQEVADEGSQDRHLQEDGPDEPVYLTRFLVRSREVHPAWLEEQPEVGPRRDQRDEREQCEFAEEERPWSGNVLSLNFPKSREVETQLCRDVTPLRSGRSGLRTPSKVRSRRNRSPGHRSGGPDGGLVHP